MSPKRRAPPIQETMLGLLTGHWIAQALFEGPRRLLRCVDLTERYDSKGANLRLWMVQEFAKRWRRPGGVAAQSSHLDQHGSVTGLERRDDNRPRVAVRRLDFRDR